MSLSVSEILLMVGKGEIAVPDFQRDFVWEPVQVVELLDSVSKDWPIGAILLLEGPQPFDVRPIDDGPEVEARSVKLYLLDGQQRVTSLWHALRDRSEIVYYCDFDEPTEDGLPDIKWDKRVNRRRLSGEFTFEELFSIRKFSDRLVDLSPQMGRRYTELRTRRLGPLASDSYRVTATVMDSKIGLDALTRIFETLNRTGVRLDAFDLMVATLRRDEFLLRDRWDEAQLEYPLLAEFGAEGLELLRLLALWQREVDRDNRLKTSARKVTGIRQKDVLNLDPSFVIDNWRRALTAYSSAVDFARKSLGIPVADQMPSQAMLLTLAVHLDAGANARDMQRWYWGSVVRQEYAQGANTRVVTDVAQLPIWDSFETLRLFETGISEVGQRNRMLRLGLRGLLRTSQALDPVKGVPLGAEVREISMSQFLGGAVRALRADPLVDLIFFNKGEVADARLRLRRGAAPLEVLLPEALESQGFVPDLFDGFDPNGRIVALEALMGEWL